jgi:hypothetical protein
MSLNILLEVLHPIEATLEFYLHITDAFGGITDAFGVHLMLSEARSSNAAQASSSKESKKGS